jgi:hypothetical protein
MNTIPTIQLSPDTGTIINALDLAAWLRRNSRSWTQIESIAQHRKMTRMETLELLALTLGLQLEQDRMDAVERVRRTIQHTIAIDPTAPLGPENPNIRTP